VLSGEVWHRVRGRIHAWAQGSRRLIAAPRWLFMRRWDLAYQQSVRGWLVWHLTQRVVRAAGRLSFWPPPPGSTLWRDMHRHRIALDQLHRRMSAFGGT
jgi:hypothetical protein